jgi:hypothetical protein
MKKELLSYVLLTVILVSALLYRSYFVDPIADEAYAEIYGVEEVGR